MKAGTQTVSRARAVVLAKACFLSLLVAVFAASLPLTCVYSLKAQLRYLAQLQDNAQAFEVSEVYAVEAVPHSVAFSIEPEAVLQRGISEFPGTTTTLYVPSGAVFVNPPQWRVVYRLVPTDDHVLARPFVRAYDPLGPPTLSA